MPARLNFFLSLLIASAIFLFLPEKVLAINLLQNGDFESGIVDPWESSGGGSTATISSELVHGGGSALKVQHSKTGSYGFQQTIEDIEGGMFYRASGYGATKNTDVSSYFLRIAWYESFDGSGSQLSSPVDSNKGDRTDGNLVWFESIVQAPLNAHSVKVRTVLNSKENGISAHVYFDDIIFEESVAPTPTPEPEEENEEESASATPTPTSTPIPTPTPKAVKAMGATLSGEVLGEEEASPEAFYPWEATDEAAAAQEATASKKGILPLALLILGLAFLGGAAYWGWHRLWYTQMSGGTKKKKEDEVSGETEETD